MALHKRFDSSYNCEKKTVFASDWEKFYKNVGFHKTISPKKDLQLHKILWLPPPKFVSGFFERAAGFRRLQ